MTRILNLLKQEHLHMSTETQKTKHVTNETRRGIWSSAVGVTSRRHCQATVREFFQHGIAYSKLVLCLANLVSYPIGAHDLTFVIRRSLMCLEMECPVPRDEGFLFLNGRHIWCAAIQQERTRTHSLQV
jgi:hypothetical protein